MPIYSSSSSSGALDLGPIIYEYSIDANSGSNFHIRIGDYYASTTVNFTDAPTDGEELVLTSYQSIQYTYTFGDDIPLINTETSEAYTPAELAGLLVDFINNQGFFTAELDDTAAIIRQVVPGEAGNQTNSTTSGVLMIGDFTGGTADFILRAPTGGVLGQVIRVLIVNPHGSAANLTIENNFTPTISYISYPTNIEVGPSFTINGWYAMCFEFVKVYENNDVWGFNGMLYSYNLD